MSVGRGHHREVGPRVAADWPVRPRVDLGHVADRPIVQPLLQQAHRLEGLPLVAHLRHDLVAARSLGDGPRLEHGVRQRLLAVHVLAGLQGGHRDHGVRVVRRRDHHRVDALLLLEHHAVVGVEGRLWVERPRLGRVGLVDVAERDDVLALARLEVGATHPADADRSDVQLVAGRLRAQHPAGNDGGGECRHGRPRGKLPAGDSAVRVVGHGWLSPKGAGVVTSNFSTSIDSRLTGTDRPA